jgi:predicted acetyltransferase
MPSNLIIRPASTDAEHDQFHRLGTLVFNPKADIETHARDGRRATERDPWFHADQVRCAFRGEQLVGGYMLYRRPIYVGTGVLQAACIGVVCTHPDFRMQGVATALMRDAISYAEQRRYSLLVLDGIADFYNRFGFIDVFDMTRHAVPRQHALALSVPAGYRVRPAQIDDVDATLHLYEQIFGRYSGRFARTPEWQRSMLTARLPMTTVVLNPAGIVSGYLVLSWSADRANAVEVLAHDWASGLALLHHHAQLLSDAPAAELIWPLPPDSELAYDLADHLHMTSRTIHHPTEGWQARPAHLPTLLDHVRFLWMQRRSDIRGDWRCLLRLSVEDTQILLEPPAIPAPDPVDIRMTPQALVQLLFGYRPVRRLASMGAIQAPEAALPALEALFPPDNMWIAGGDAF